jgi:hypothetical protein
VPAETRTSQGNGIGLRNVNERLRVIYGANYQLQLDSVPGEGTCARIVIPELEAPGPHHCLTMHETDDLRTVVVDDEQLAREELCFPPAAARWNRSGRPGGERGRSAARHRGAPARPRDARRPNAWHHRLRVARRVLRAGLESQLVFVTAFDQYAIEAFDVNAVDYC